ncbi:DUF3010 family protein [Sphingomonas sp. Leaf28]|uniref:DUF3010 family protein n=1 Tax=Sphingomonas sp. Leaf28 TaxID=1735695 RepID=UPI0009E7606E|nr:DUF3010 family protein [Sphingomonas sp. Leaf28]
MLAVIICGVDIKAKDAILAIVKSDTDDNIEHLNCTTKRITLNDHEDVASLHAFMKAINAFANENRVEGFVIKTRQATGQLAAGGITFKIETLFQLSNVEVSFVSPPTLSAFQKKSNVATPPQSIKKFQADAYRAAAWKVAKI